MQIIYLMTVDIWLGTVPADQFWNNNKVTWKNTSTAFGACSQAIRAQVPVSWGGTASDDIINPTFNDIINNINDINNELSDKDDKSYSAFEVLVSGQFTTHKFIIKTEINDATNSDIKVDWGDGTISIIANGDYENFFLNGSKYYIIMSHTYTADGNYIVKILGKTYYAIVGNITDGAGITGYTEADAKTYNIMSRCFAEDLPIASCLTNLSSFAAYAKYLQVVKVPQTMSFANIENAAKVFANCFNLTSVTGIGYKLAHCRSVDSFFNNCTSLTTTDFVIPQDIQISGRY